MDTLVVGGPLDGHVIASDSDSLLYPESDVNEPEFRYLKKGLWIDDGPDTKKYEFWVPEDWGIFEVMDHLTKRYSDAIPIQDF